MQINWDTNLFDLGCTLHVYSDGACRAQTKSFGFHDYYGPLGVNAKAWNVTGC